jgi:formylglycine-generating enzyme required for sulfatase activity
LIPKATFIMGSPLNELYRDKRKIQHKVIIIKPLNPKINPPRPDSGTMKIQQGGSWFKYGYSYRSVNRNSDHPGSRFQTTGFMLMGKKMADQDRIRERP